MEMLESLGIMQDSEKPKAPDETDTKEHIVEEAAHQQQIDN